MQHPKIGPIIGIRRKVGHLFRLIASTANSISPIQIFTTSNYGLWGGTQSVSETSPLEIYFYGGEEVPVKFSAKNMFLAAVQAKCRRKCRF